MKFGFETPALFRHYAKVTMQEIMEGYLLKIYTKFLEYDPLSSVDYTETYTRNIEGESGSEGSSNSTSNSNSSGFNINQDTPQNQITKESLLNGTYSSNSQGQESETEVTDETKTSQTGKSKTIETYEHTMKGDNGVVVTNQYLVREFREIANNFNLEIIKDLNTLFMGLY